MKFEAFYPIDPLLKNCIKYYYFVNTDNDEHFSKYCSFPNVTIPVNIHKNVNTQIDKNIIKISHTITNAYKTIINGLREIPLIVEWRGRIDKVTIVFKPGCLNYFISRPCSDFSQDFSQIFSEWNSNASYVKCLNKFYQTNDKKKRVSLLEDFLLSIYQPFYKSAEIIKSIALIQNFDEEKPLPLIAREVGLSSRHFNRLFNAYVGISPIKFKKIARFRHSLKNKLLNDQFKKLTAIGYESNYYDQAYFIKIYNQLTGKSPKDLYKSITKLADENILFQFIQV